MEVDVANGCAALGKPVLNDQIRHAHVVSLGDVDHAELVAKHRRNMHLRMCA
jgi:hypothetical protein